MYVIIIAIHALFIGVSHALGYRIFEGIFALLCLFFLFYFSPLFFLDQKKDPDALLSVDRIKHSLFQFSPKDSLIIPTILLYVAIYGFSVAVFSGDIDIFFLHSGIITGVYLLFIGYALAFFWKHDVFFELFRFHTLFVLISSILFSLSYFFQGDGIPFIQIYTIFLGIFGATFLLLMSRQESPLFLISYTISLYILLCLSMAIFSSERLLFLCLFVIPLFSIFLFEIFPLHHWFRNYTEFFRYFGLIILLLSIPFLMFFLLQGFSSGLILLLSIILLFFLSVHIRFMNYVAFAVSVFLSFFLYYTLFSDLIFDPTLLTVFLFIFFLSFLIIGTTYFWEEQHPYDFIILHYSSIAFSIIFSIYSIFFIGWGSDFLFVVSLCFFGIALLFFLSYFRFRSLR